MRARSSELTWELRTRPRSIIEIVGTIVAAADQAEALKEEP